MVVAVAVGRKGIDSLLVISQVILSIVLPFVTFPLIYVTSSRLAMRVKKPRANSRNINEKASSEDMKEKESAGDVAVIRRTDGSDSLDLPRVPKHGSEDIEVVDKKAKRSDTEDSDGESSEEDEYVDYSNGWVLTIISYAIWFVILIANCYMIVTLAIGDA
jgi:metal iron transporter